MKQALVIGGSNGIGMALSLQLLENDYNVIIADRTEPDFDYNKNRVKYVQINLLNLIYLLLESLFLNQIYL